MIAFLMLLLASSTRGLGLVTAAISGRVEDSSGASMSGVKITVKTLETGGARSVITDQAGRYRVLSLPPGPQQVKGERAGFRTAVRTGICLLYTSRCV